MSGGLTSYSTLYRSFRGRFLQVRWPSQQRHCAVKSYPLVNDCDLLAGFSDFCIPFSYLTPSVMEVPSSYRVHKIIWYRKTRTTDLQSGDQGSTMIVVRALYTWTWQTHRQPRRHSKYRANARRRAAKIVQLCKSNSINIRSYNSRPTLLIRWGCSWSSCWVKCSQCKVI